MIFSLSSNQQQKFEYFTGWHFIAFSSLVFKEDDRSWKGKNRMSLRADKDQEWNSALDQE